MELFHVDAFTDRPFAGNPAGVCLLDGERDAAWMQHVASELHLPATAFVARDRRLRWFSVSTELEICGHATLAAAHVLWETGALPPDAPASFATRAGTVTAAREGGAIFLSFAPGAVERADAEPLLLEAVGVEVESVWRTPLDYLLVVADADAVAALEPDVERIARVDTRGVIVTAAGGDGVDFTSRFFAPRVGSPEDAVTGSAHASLAPFWAARLGKTTLRARQASRRGGFLDLRVHERTVQVGGPAVTVARGELVS